MADVVTASSALTATVVAVCTPPRMAQTSADLEAVRQRSAVRTILISLGTDPQPRVETTDGAVTIVGIVPRYLNNAVASLRLSSLPSIAWWRGSDPSLLLDLAELVDRLVLDAESVTDAWPLVPRLAELTQVSDLRWTRLTRWRTLTAQLFDLPGISGRAGAFSTLQIAGDDQDTAALFASWLDGRLNTRPRLRREIVRAARGHALESVTLSGDGIRLSLEQLPNQTCIATTVLVDGRTVTSRVVPGGEQSNDALLREELRISARDHAFEDAVRGVVEQPR